jgi:hypothetical protein
MSAERHEHADAPHALALLRRRAERPRAAAICPLTGASRGDRPPQRCPVAAPGAAEFLASPLTGDAASGQPGRARSQPAYSSTTPPTSGGAPIHPVANCVYERHLRYFAREVGARSCPIVEGRSEAVHGNVSAAPHIEGVGAPLQPGRTTSPRPTTPSVCILHWNDFATRRRFQVTHRRRKPAADVLGSSAKRIGIKVRVSCGG